MKIEDIYIHYLEIEVIPITKTRIFLGDQY